jgi:hypothetical protein
LLQFQDPTTSLRVQSTYTPWCLNPGVQDTSPLHNRTKFLSTATLEIQYETKLCAQDWISEVVLDPPETTLPWKDPNWATLTMKFRTVIPQLNFPSISEGICPPQTAFFHNECYKQVRGSQRMITRHLFESSIRECSGLIRKRVSSAVSCSWSRSPLEGLISSSTSAFRAPELLCVIAIAQIQQFRCPISTFLKLLKFRTLWHDWKKLQ